MPENVVASLLRVGNRVFPWAKRLVPFRIYRGLIRAVFSTERESRNRPHRRWIMDVMLPRLAAGNPARVVFVGCGSYTWFYERLFDNRRTDYITVDSSPAARVWGSDHHLSVPAQDLDRHLAEDSVDVLLLLGVYGAGLDGRDELRKAVTGAHRVLKPGGAFVLSWDPEISEDPMGDSVFTRLFTPGSVPGLPDRQAFPTMIIAFFCKSPTSVSGIQGDSP